jgi:hypothetical protein
MRTLVSLIGAVAFGATAALCSDPHHANPRRAGPHDWGRAGRRLASSGRQ